MFFHNMLEIKDFLHCLKIFWYKVEQIWATFFETGKKKLRKIAKKIVRLELFIDFRWVPEKKCFYLQKKGWQLALIRWQNCFD